MAQRDARVGALAAGSGGRAGGRGPPLALVLAVALLTVTAEGSRRVCGLLRKSNEVAQGCVVKGDGGMKFMADHAGEDCIASGTFVDSAFTSSNFGKLRVVTEPGHSDADQAFAAGYLEGYLTAARMYDHHYNLKVYFNTMLNETTSLEEALDWLEVQEQLSNDEMRHAPAGDSYWRLLALVQAQFNGLVAGYQARAREEARLLARRGSQQQQQQQQHAGEEDAARSSRRLAAGTRAAAVGLGGGAGGGGVAVGWLDRRDIMFLNSNGDVYDIIDALEAGYGRNANSSRNDGGDRLPSWAKLDDDPTRMALKLGLQGKCSALVKVTGDLGELLMGHSTHDSFTAMTRIYKHYDFGGLADAAVVAKQVSFSSYPGELFSDDDFYLLSSGLVVLETTNHIYQGDIFRALHQQDVVLSWQRIRLANWMASNGEDWIKLFSRHNSGTYNNQYMVVNTNRFVPYRPMQPGLLWVAEQLPGFIKAADMTEELSRGYWPSYNVAFFPEVYEAAGYPYMIDQLRRAGAKKYDFSIRLLEYQVAPRASIFRRDQGSVSSLEHLKHLMRYNDYQHDPIAQGNPVGAVCARGDLAKGDSAIAKGCYDSKVTSASLAARMESEVVGGPTAQGQAPFKWSDPRWAGLPHRGMPETFDFSFERMSPRDLPTLQECAGAEAEEAGAVEAEEVSAVSDRS